MGSYQDEWEVEDLANNEVTSSNDVAEDNDKEVDSNIPAKKRKKTKNGILKQRSEASLNISEFNLTEVGKEKIKINELIKTSLKTTGQGTHKNFQSVKKLKKLSVPLSKQQQQRIRNTVAQEKICEEVTKWDSLIHANRTAEQLVFPLKKPDFQMQVMDNVAENFVSKHPVEIAVSELLATSENRLESGKPLTAAEEKALQAMSAAEAKQRHEELMKHRALISYKESKARYQNKIKSKKYHRLMKKEKLKKAMKEFEELKNNDEDKALEKFAELDKLRILERMTLKHRNTGKWAKQQKIRAKYNPESRGVLKEDINIGRQLREKVDLPEEVAQNLHSHVKINPSTSDLGLIEETYSEDENQNASESNPIEDALLEAYGKELSETQEKTKKAEKPKTKKKKKETVEDIMNFVSKEQCLDSAIPNGLSLGDEDLDEIMGDIMPISEAFGDEDVIAEFRAEKEAAEKANKLEGINMFLPGWGCWGGPGIQQSKKKMKRFIIKPPVAPPKKDTLGNVIINEDKDKKAALHQVSMLPFPFTNVHQFESYIRQPIGHTWNPQSSFQNLVAPKVITKMGKIIEPIDSEDLVLKKNSSKQTNKKGQRKKKGPGELKAF